MWSVPGRPSGKCKDPVAAGNRASEGSLDRALEGFWGGVRYESDPGEEVGVTEGRALEPLYVTQESLKVSAYSNQST